MAREKNNSPVKIRSSKHSILDCIFCHPNIADSLHCLSVQIHRTEIKTIKTKSHSYKQKWRNWFAVVFLCTNGKQLPVKYTLSTTLHLPLEAYLRHLFVVLVSKRQKALQKRYEEFQSAVVPVTDRVVLPVIKNPANMHALKISSLTYSITDGLKVKVTQLPNNLYVCIFRIRSHSNKGLL